VEQIQYATIVISSDMKMKPENCLKPHVRKKTENGSQRDSYTQSSQTKGGLNIDSYASDVQSDARNESDSAEEKEGARL
jgi:hypothetical protein